MESCEHENGIMVFDSDDCPMCEAESRIQELEDELEDETNRIAGLEAQLIKADLDNVRLESQLDKLYEEPL